MNPQRTVMATWLAMLGLQTIGSVDSQHKLPAPKQYVAIGALWGLLFLMVDTGLARVAARLSVLLLLTASVIGPFGTKFVGLLSQITKTFAIAPPASAPSAPTPPSSPSGNALPSRVFPA